MYLPFLPRSPYKIYSMPNPRSPSSAPPVRKTRTRLKPRSLLHENASAHRTGRKDLRKPKGHDTKKNKFVSRNARKNKSISRKITQILRSGHQRSKMMAPARRYTKLGGIPPELNCSMLSPRQYVLCERCMGWYHLGCVALRADLENDTRWECPPCTK